jgi:phage FluMu protein Com
MNIAKFHCPNCSKSLDSALNLAVWDVECPECKFIFRPVVESVELDPESTSESEQQGESGIEAKLKNIADVLFFAGVIGAIAAALSCVASIVNQMPGAFSIGIACAAPVAFIQGVVFQTLFLAFAEIIHQLRRINSK